MTDPKPAQSKARLEVDLNNGNFDSDEQEEDVRTVLNALAEAERDLARACHMNHAESDDHDCADEIVVYRQQAEVREANLREALQLLLAELDQHGIGCASLRHGSCNCARREADAALAASPEPKGGHQTVTVPTGKGAGAWMLKCSCGNPLPCSAALAASPEPAPPKCGCPVPDCQHHRGLAKYPEPAPPEEK